MELQYTLKHYVLQLKNKPRTLINVAGVVQQIMKTVYDVHFPNAEARRPGRNPKCPDADILTLAWLLEYIGVSDSEHAGYRRLKLELRTLFPSLPERSRFNRRRRNLRVASEVVRETLRTCLAGSDMFIVDSFPIPICDVKRAPTSSSDLKWADASGCLATYGHCATKSPGTFFGFRGHVITTGDGVPVDSTIAAAHIDDREVLPLLCQRGRYPIVLGDKGYVSESLQDALLETENTCLFPTRRRNQKQQYPEAFGKQQVRLRRRVETTLQQPFPVCVRVGIRDL